MHKRIIYVTGLPRSGSTLLCQLLGHHREICSNGHSSPLAMMLNRLRRNVSDNEFFLSQLDVDFEQGYAQLEASFRGMMDGWFSSHDEPVVVDKNRFWLRMVEQLYDLDPDFKMIVCIRDIRQIIGSVEAQHSKTRSLDFPDHLDAHSVANRFEKLLADEGIVGSCLKNIEFIQEIEDPKIHQRLCFIAFESLVNFPQKAMRTIFEFLQIEPAEIDYQNLHVRPNESDSYYRFKYPHRTFNSIAVPTEHHIPERLRIKIEEKYAWFYKQFYPALELSNIAGEV